MEKNKQTTLRKWITSKLDEQGHGAKSRLAKHIGVNRDAITRMLKQSDEQGYRAIKAEELAKIVDFFGEVPPHFVWPAPLNDNAANEASQGGDIDKKIMVLFSSLSQEDKVAFLNIVKIFFASKARKS